MIYRFFVFSACIIFFCSLVIGQTESITIEAESGVLETDFIILNDGNIQYVTNQTVGAAQYPGDSSRVITYNVIFPFPGVYDLYARIRVGAGNANDDSFFYGNGFGEKPTTNESSWVTINNLYLCGFNLANDIVTANGELRSGVWKWVNLSKFTQADIPTSFTVSENNHTQTFQIGGRENGLDIDKFVFGKANLFYTVSNLENGQPGVTNPPGLILPIAYGLPKFIGNVYSSSQWPDFTKYWNQITPENAGKWGSVEGTRDVMNWTTLDLAYKAAKDNFIPFKMHVMIWGNQQPSWIESLSKEAQLEEIKEWFAAVANRYPNIDFVEVVNEPLHDPPNQAGNGGGNYMEALGGSGTTSWDWIITAFKLGRQYFPNAKLMLNEYSITNSDTDAQRYVAIINLLKKDTLIDQIGVQGHAFSLGASAPTVTGNLNRLAATGLPIYVTEMDIDGPTDEIQLKDYQRIFPLFWNHPSVLGITFWGFKTGMWRTTQKAYLVNPDGSERPALVWLRAFVNGTFVSADSIRVTGENGATTISTDNGTLQLLSTIFPDSTTFKKITWSVNDQSKASINQDGLLSALNNGIVTISASSTDGSDKKGSMVVTISNQTVTGINEIELPGREKITVFPNPVYNGHFTIDGIEEIINIKIFGIEGNLIKEFHPENKSSLSVNLNLNPGIYLLQINDGQRIYPKKIIFNQ